MSTLCGEFVDDAAQLGCHRAVAEFGKGVCQLVVVPVLLVAGHAEAGEDVVASARVEEDCAGIVEFVGE